MIMNLFNFTEHFGSEEDCRNHFKGERDKVGVNCKNCGFDGHYWIESRWSHERKKCRSRTSLRSGTTMQSSNLSFMIRYKTMFLLSATKKGFSTREIQRRLGMKRCEPVWATIHELRGAMGNRDDRCTLEGMMEMGEGHFTMGASGQEHKTQKAGRGSKTKSNTMIMAESTVLEGLETGKVERQCRYFKAKVLDGHGSGEAGQALKNSIDGERAIVFADQSTSYVDIADCVEMHISEKSSKETTRETLKWVHVAISNAKRNFVGTYHKMKRKYLQLYLNEFIHKLNRRYFGERLFDGLVMAGITGL